jgi:hypothetical protein
MVFYLYTKSLILKIVNPENIIYKINNDLEIKKYPNLSCIQLFLINILFG